MGIKETFNFDDSTYEEKLKGMSTDQIQSREVVKIRQYISGSIGVGCILGAAMSTMGASLVVLPYVLRMVNIARRKLNIIRRVLFRRGIPPYELTKRDFVIPLAIRATSLGLGAAVGLFIDITTVMPLDKVSPSGYDAVSSAVNNPDATLKGFTDGFTEQGNQAAIEETARHAVAHQQISNDLPAHDVAQSGFQSTPDPILDIESDPAYLTGMQQGATVASLMESKAVTAALSQLPLVVQMPWERGDNQDETAQFHISCDKCEKAFEASRTQHWHCSDCADGDFDICAECYDAGERCLDRNHIMIRMPLQLPPDTATKTSKSQSNGGSRSVYYWRRKTDPIISTHSDKAFS